MAVNEAVNLARLLGDVGRARPANLTFVRAARVRLRGDGGARAGTLDDIADYYRSLDLGRLIVVGEPGSGKTVLVLRLVLDLVSSFLDRPDPCPANGARVPVRLSLSEFALQSESMDAVEVCDLLDAWIAARLTRVHGVRCGIATALVAEGWVLPVLDGLDEMDPKHGPLLRAGQVLTGLNHPAGLAPRPVVLTCRSDVYRRLENLERDVPNAPQSLNNPTETIRPLPPATAEPVGISDATTIVSNR